MRLARCLLPAVALAALAASPSFAATTTPRALPTVERTVSAAKALKRDCTAGTATGRGVTTTRWTAPDTGYVSVRLRGGE
jgi:uncharacterized membrane protein